MDNDFKGSFFYTEELFVEPMYRGKGIAKEIFSDLPQIVGNGCGQKIELLIHHAAEIPECGYKQNVLCDIYRKCGFTVNDGICIK